MFLAYWRRLAFVLACPLFAGPALAGEAGVVVAERIADYDRLSIDWRQAVDYRVHRAQGRVTIEFSTATPLDADEVDASLHSGLGALRVEGNRLFLRVPPATRVRHYRNGPRFVIDLLSAPSDRGARLAFVAETLEP